MPKATLQNQKGQKVVVEANSPQAQQYFAQGYKLMQPKPQQVNNNISKPSTQIPTGAVPISGVQYPTRDLQRQNFSNIQPIGNTLYGVPNQPSTGDTSGNQDFNVDTSGGQGTQDYWQQLINSFNVKTDGSISGSSLTGDTTTQTDYQKALADAQKAYTDYSTSSEARQQQLADLLTQISTLTTSKEAGMNAIEDKVVPMQEITGEQASLEKQANAKINAVTNQYNALNQTEQNAQQRAETLMKLAQSPFDLQKVAAQAQQEQDTAYKNTATNVAPNILNSLTGDAVKDAATINQISKQTGVPAQYLMSGVLNYKNDKQKQDIINSKGVADILQNTPSGGTINIPGFGDAQIIGTKKEIVKSDQGVYMLDPYTGAYVKTDIPPDKLESQLLGLLVKAGDPNTVKYILDALGLTNNGTSGSGVSEPIYTSGSDFRTDRHNNPIAASVATGKTNQYTKALDAAGIKWTYGDYFPNDKSMQTIKITDPKQAEEASRAILSNTNAIQGWYNTSKWGDDKKRSFFNSYGISNNEDFKRADVNTQNDIIEHIYAGEGGNGKLVGKETMSDEEAIARGIESGEQPPELTRLYGKSAKVRAILSRDKFDLTNATLDWTAMSTYMKNLNGNQQIRLRQAVQFAGDSLDLVDQLNNEWAALGKSTKLPVLNKVNLVAAMNGVYGSKAQDAATKLNSQISDLVSELATVYKGGNTSTDESLRLAARQLASNWSPEQLKSATDLVRKNLTIRKASILQAGAIGTGADGQNQYQALNQSNEKANDLQGNMDSFIQNGKYLGSDGKMSPQSWSYLKGLWQKEGGKADDFDIMFFKYKNQLNPNYK